MGVTSLLKLFSMICNTGVFWANFYHYLFFTTGIGQAVSPPD